MGWLLRRGVGHGTQRILDGPGHLGLAAGALVGGRYATSPRCDCCGKPVGTAYYTDTDVCGGSDGPGFYLCERVRCVAKRDGLSVEERRALYTATRAATRAASATI